MSNDFVFLSFNFTPPPPLPKKQFGVLVVRPPALEAIVVVMKRIAIQQSN